MPPVSIARGGLRVSKDTSAAKCSRTLSIMACGFPVGAATAAMDHGGIGAVAAPAGMIRPACAAATALAHDLLTSAQSVLLMPNSLMKPSASSTPQSADCA